MFSKVFTWVAKAAAVTVAGIAAKEIAVRSKRLLDERRAANSALSDADQNSDGQSNIQSNDQSNIQGNRDRHQGVVEDADRSSQRAPDGTGLVDEWGEESFPASDAPQSW
ncbi:MAG: hypothetical protein KJO36_02880 [Acidimicrobiia bacterium]|nr:hypothetical protein [Acidimicrobiia bacterium]